MKIAADFKQRVVVQSHLQEWVTSPVVGVNRKSLDRVGDEVARATSLVKYDAGSQFTEHTHTGGEEFIVLEGIFEDEHGQFPVGSYIRNPPQSKHQPGSKEGCTMLVKLWQFQESDCTHVRLQMQNMGKVAIADQQGICITPLYKDNLEEVSLLYFEPDATYVLNAFLGAEIFVLDGSVKESNDILIKHGWLRSPVNSQLSIKAGKEGARIWVKSGHLIAIDEQIERVMKA